MRNIVVLIVLRSLSFRSMYIFIAKNKSFDLWTYYYRIVVFILLTFDFIYIKYYINLQFTSSVLNNYWNIFKGILYSIYYVVLLHLLICNDDKL